MNVASGGHLQWPHGGTKDSRTEFIIMTSREIEEYWLVVNVSHGVYCNSGVASTLPDHRTLVSKELKILGLVADTDPGSGLASECRD